MIINEKIIHDIQVLDLTLSIRAVREVPDAIRISVRNDEYVCSYFLYKDEYNNDSTAILEFIIDDFKRKVN